MVLFIFSTGTDLPESFTSMSNLYICGSYAEALRLQIFTESDNRQRGKEK